MSYSAVVSVWHRNAMVWREMMVSALTANVLNPLIFLYAFGFGLGKMLNNMDGVPYMAWVVPGMMAYGAMFTASFETAVNTYTRFRTQKVYDAILATPVTMSEINAGEVFWASTKGMLSAGAVLFVGWIFGGVIGGWQALLSIPVLFLGGVCFAACGLYATSKAKGYDFFNYFFTLWITPNFLLTGVFYSVDRYPEWIQNVSFFLPMTHLVTAARTLTAGLPITIDLLWQCLYLLLWTIVALYFADKNLRRRLFD